MSLTQRRLPRGLALLALGFAFAPFVLKAQSVQTPPVDTVPMAPTVLTVVGPSNVTKAITSGAPATAAAGPRIVPVALTAFTRADAPTPSPQPEDNANLGPNLALMGAGAAGIVVGLLIGGDGGTAIALGGGVVGLIGLYRYLR